MSALLRRSSRRWLTRHPWQTGLSTLGIALGVAVVVAVGLANESAARGFDLSTEALVGATTHHVVGGPQGIPDAAYARLRVGHAIRRSAPVVEGNVVVPSRPDRPWRSLRVLGLDPFADVPFRGVLGADEGGAPGAVPATLPLGTLLTDPGAALLGAATARDLGLAPGDRLEVLTGTTRRAVLVAGVLAPRDEAARAGLRDLLVMDVAAAQELLGREGRLDRIDLIAPAAGREAWAGRVRAALPPGLQLVDAAARSGAIGGMTRAFRLNLTALSLLALLCGVFLIYNTMTFSVVQRRPLLGLLRAAGVGRGEIFRLVLGEAALIGITGTLAGLALGTWLARGLLGLVTRTINDLYYATSVRDVALDPLTLALGFLLGVAATVAAALPPAIEATLSPPRATLTRSVIEERVRRAIPRAAFAGLALALLGALLLLWPSRSVVLAFGGLFALLVGCALLVPLAVVGLMRAAAPLAGRATGALGRMAARNVVASLSRTAVAIAALMVAVSVVVGVGLMIRSFRQAVVRWLDVTLASDVYVSAGTPAPNRSDVPLPPEVVERVTTLPGVGGHNALYGALLETPKGGVRLLAVSLDPRGRDMFELIGGEAGPAWAAVARGAVLVSEPFAFRHAVGPGDTLELPAARGTVRLPVAGVYVSYGTDQGAVLIDRGRYAALWDDARVSALGLYAAAGVDPDDLVARVRAAAGGRPLAIQSNRVLRRTSLAIFDRTFTITAVLRLLVGAVAFIGVLTALLALHLERSREIALLRASGLGRAQVFGLVTAECGLLGLAAGLLALPVGILQAAAMIFVINRRSFGWTLPMQLDAGTLLGALALAVGAALLAGLVPAWRMTRTAPALALRAE